MYRQGKDLLNHREFWYSFMNINLHFTSIQDPNLLVQRTNVYQLIDRSIIFQSHSDWVGENHHSTGRDRRGVIYCS